MSLIPKKSAGNREKSEYSDFSRKPQTTANNADNEEPHGSTELPCKKMLVKSFSPKRTGYGASHEHETQQKKKQIDSQAKQNYRN